MFITFFFALKARLRVFKFEFCQIKLGDRDKLATQAKFRLVEL